MNVTDLILETIAELAKEKKCAEDKIDWHTISIRLATKLLAVKNLELTAVSHHRELLLQAYKEGFDAATDCLIGANKVVQERKLQ